MKNYLGEMIDLTGDSYLNPVPAIYDNGQHIRNVGVISSIAIHHDASFRPHDYDSVARYHQEAAEHYNRLGPGLQYHYKIDNVGQIFKIRPHELWTYSVGTAENVTCLAICLDGNFETQMPTKEQFEALYQLLENLCEQHPEFPATWPNCRSHNDYSATACCGANLRNRILAINSKADAQAQLLNVGDYDWPEYQDSPPSTVPEAPKPTPTPVPTEPGSTPLPTPTPVPETPPTPAPKEQQDNVNVSPETLSALLGAFWKLIKRLFGIKS